MHIEFLSLLSFFFLFPRVLKKIQIVEAIASCVATLDLKGWHDRPRLGRDTRAFLKPALLQKRAHRVRDLAAIEKSKRM
jgi:hypothetical protein